MQDIKFQPFIRCDTLAGRIKLVKIITKSKSQCINIKLYDNWLD